jgi:hypothetical protein
LIATFRRMAKAGDNEDLVSHVLRSHGLRGPILRIFHTMKVDNCIDWKQLRAIAKAIESGSSGPPEKKLVTSGTAATSSGSSGPPEKKRCLDRRNTV